MLPLLSVHILLMMLLACLLRLFRTISATVTFHLRDLPLAGIRATAALVLLRAFLMPLPFPGHTVSTPSVLLPTARLFGLAEGTARPAMRPSTSPLTVMKMTMKSSNHPHLLPVVTMTREYLQQIYNRISLTHNFLT